jgi:RND family efflux transporter MFP subunit
LITIYNKPTIMKHLIILSIALVTLASCGGGNQQSLDELIAQGDLEAIRQRKNELSEQQKSLDGQIKVIDSAIAVLDTDENYPLVSALEIQKEVFTHYLELQGNVKTKQNVLIYPEMAGTLEKVHVQEGQWVKKGQLLATIDDGGLSSQLEQLKTEEELSKTTFERQKRLWEQNIGSEIQYLQAKTNYEAQQNTVKQLQSQLGKSAIRAPFTGIIDDVIKDEGTVVSPGAESEVFRIVNLSEMYINVEVPERYLGSVTQGKEVKVFFPVLSDSVVTRVRTTGNFINPNNRSFIAEIPVPNKDGAFKPNLTARVRINDYTNEEALLIPQSIISENAEGEQYVYIAEKIEGGEISQVKKSIIHTGRTQGAQVEVLAGLTAGELVIREGARSVKDGQKVELITLK